MCVTRIAFSLSSCLHPAPTHCVASVLVSSPMNIARLIRKWPHPELLLADLPQPGEAARLDREEEDDQGANDHQLNVFDGCSANRHTEGVGQAAQHDRQTPDQGGAEKRTDQA